MIKLQWITFKSLKKNQHQKEFLATGLALELAQPAAFLGISVKFHENTTMILI